MPMRKGCGVVDTLETTEIRKVLVFSPAGQEPKVFSTRTVEGRPTLIKRGQSTTQFELSGEKYRCLTDDWRQRKVRGYIYVA